MGQKFYAHPTDTFEWPNGAIGHRGGAGSFDCLGPYAKVRNCPIQGLPGKRLTCYATGYADTAFSVPACTAIKGKYIGGYFAFGGSTDSVEFRVTNSYRKRAGLPVLETVPPKEFGDGLWKLSIDGVIDGDFENCKSEGSAVFWGQRYYPDTPIITVDQAAHSTNRGQL